MAEFGKKGVMGYKVLPGGRNDSESTHAILSLEEYDELLRRDNSVASFTYSLF